MIRSAAICQREGYPKERQQINDITGVVDASNIYGSSKKESDNLRDKRSKIYFSKLGLPYSQLAWILNTRNISVIFMIEYPCFPSEKLNLVCV